MKVLLGPAHELHAGVHGSLLATPPPQTTYVHGASVLRFRPDREAAEPFSPLHDPAVAEWVQFVDTPSDVAVVHSSRLPVQSPLPWIVDADSLLTPLLVGRFFALGAASRGDPPLPDPGAIARREAAMAARYASRRCARILFRTDRARRTFLDHLVGRGLAAEKVETLAAKSEVVFPAVPATAPAVRRPGHPVGVLYMGRTAQDKGARVAADVFTHLRARHREAVRLVFVGPYPDDVADRLRSIGTELVAILPRSDYLEQLRQADIFLSPTSFESFGMGLVEAAAAGLAIVCAGGPGLEHLGELLTPGENALVVPNTGPVAQRATGFAAALSALIDDEPLRRRLRTNNYALTSRGRLSLRQRDERLRAAYTDAAALGADPHGHEAIADEPRDPGEGTRGVIDWADEVCRWADQHCVARVGGRVTV